MKSRRHADDFTDSLQSFRQTFGEECDQTSQVLRDSLDTDSVKEEQNRYTKHRCPKCSSSTILASNLANERFVQCQTSNERCKAICKMESMSEDSLDEASYKLRKVDLNKCINLFHNELLEKEREICEDYTSISSISFETKGSDNSHSLSQSKSLKRQYNIMGPLAASLNSLKVDTPVNKIKKSKSCTTLTGNSKVDTNHNIKACEFFVEPNKPSSHREMETIVFLLDNLSLSESVSSSKNDLQFIRKEDEKCNSVNSENTSKDIAITELKTCLQLLEDQEKPLTEPTIQKHMLKRLSTTFYDSPRNFTERLLTIIEESTLSNNLEPLEYPDVSLCRLTEEIRKRCKFIENETAPEWPASPGMLTSTSPGKEDQVSASNSPQKSLDVPRSPSKDVYTITYASPISSRRSSRSLKNIRWRLSKNISTALNAKRSPMRDTSFDATSTFENLEAYCKRLFPEEYKTSPMRRENLSQLFLQDISNIQHKCHDQLASLEASPNVREQLRGAVKSIVDSENREADSTAEIQGHLYGSGKRDRLKSKDTPLLAKCSRARCIKRPDMAELDLLENTLLYEIAKRRQSCLNAVKQMTEIDANPKTLDARETCRTVNQKKSSPVYDVDDDHHDDNDNDNKLLMKTLMSCKDYKDYVEEFKPLLTLLQRRKSTSRSQSNEKNSHAKKANKQTLRVPTLNTAVTRHKSRSPLPRVPYSKPKLFVTPGKTPVKKTTKHGNRTYFPSLWNDKQKRENVEPDKKSYINPHAQSVFRKIGMNYNDVVSPVGMYIRGTNPHLIKNLRPKTNEMLLTPRKKQTAQSASPKPKMKFKLSPKTKQGNEVTKKDEEMSNNFLHPNVHYKLPSHVRTIKETENKKVGNRVNELLRSTQDKVVIRHEGRTKTVQSDSSEQLEIRYDSAEESVHVEQTARKTCYSCVQKEY